MGAAVRARYCCSLSMLSACMQYGAPQLLPYVLGINLACLTESASANILPCMALLA
jgi:hypothetical protein